MAAVAFFDPKFPIYQDNDQLGIGDIQSLPQDVGAPPAPNHWRFSHSLSDKIALIYPPSGDAAGTVTVRLTQWLTVRGYHVIVADAETTATMHLDHRFTRTLPANQPYVVVDYASMPPKSLADAGWLRRNFELLEAFEQVGSSLVVPLADASGSAQKYRRALGNSAVGIVNYANTNLYEIVAQTPAAALHNSGELTLIDGIIAPKTHHLIIARDENAQRNLQRKVAHPVGEGKGRVAVVLFANEMSWHNFDVAPWQQAGIKRILAFLPDIITDEIRRVARNVEIVVFKSAQELVQAWQEPYPPRGGGQRGNIRTLDAA